MSSRYYRKDVDLLLSMTIMKKHAAPSDLADKFMLRLPEGMRDRIAHAAEGIGVSMNSLIVRALDREFPSTPTHEELLNELDRLTSRLEQGEEDNSDILSGIRSLHSMVQKRATEKQKIRPQRETITMAADVAKGKEKEAFRLISKNKAYIESILIRVSSDDADSVINYTENNPYTSVRIVFKATISERYNLMKARDTLFALRPLGENHPPSNNPPTRHPPTTKKAP